MCVDEFCFYLKKRCKDTDNFRIGKRFGKINVTRAWNYGFSSLTSQGENIITWDGCPPAQMMSMNIHCCPSTNIHRHRARISSDSTHEYPPSEERSCSTLYTYSVAVTTPTL